jgi:hypothetical protein
VAIEFVWVAEEANPRERNDNGPGRLCVCVRACVNLRSEPIKVGRGLLLEGAS